MRRAAEARRAVPSDAAVAREIVAGALAEYGLPFDPEGRDADVALFGARDDHDDFVAEDEGGRPVGVVSVGPHGEPGVGWLSKLFVVRDARGRGVGRMLLDRAHEAARARGMTRIGLRTRSRFREATALYESDGYTLGSAPRVETETGDRIYWRRL